MDNDELKYYRYIHTLNEIFESSIEKYEDEIRLFNEYISSNRNFKYNKTYLNDSISDFFEVCKIFQSKKQKVEEFYKNITEQYESLENWYIVVDHLFLIQNNGVILLLDELESKNSILPNKEAVLKKELQLFNLYSMDRKNLIVKYYLDDDLNLQEYTQKFSLIDEIKINSYIGKKLVERERKNGR